MNSPLTRVAQIFGPVAPFAFRTAGAIAFGRGASQTLGETLARFGQRVLLVTGARSFAASGALDRARERFASAGLHVEMLTVSGEPDVDTVDRGVSAARECGAQVVAAIGGGRKIGAPPLPLIAVPTTAGTGSEVTRNAVLRVPEAAVKRSMRDDRMMPSVAVVDPDLVATARDVAVPAALDAMTHLIESYVSLGAQPTTDLIAFEGARRAAFALRMLADGRETTGVWDELALVSLWGGLALANAGLGAVHGLAAPLGGRCAIGHGAACAALLAPTIRANIEALRARSRGAPALARFEALAVALSASDDPMRLADDIDILRRRLRARSLGALGARPADVSEIVTMARGGSMKHNPVVLTDRELESILLAAMGESGEGGT
jgi:alcohol dehydrogenase class IV